MIRRMISVVAMALVCLSLVLGQSPGPKNVILMIGDGMGIAQVTAGRTHKGWLELDKFTIGGFSLTHPAGDDYITDSAAGGTALASGVKTLNGMIGMKPDKTVVKNVAEIAASLGKKAGIVVACSITHATPACFLAHNESRYNQFDIAEQIAADDVDVLLGGGWGWFLPPAEGGRRKDGKDLLKVMTARGFLYVSTPQDFQGVEFAHTDKLLGLFADDQVGPASERNPSLPSMTEAALTVLSRSKKGFFLMVEGSQIDWGGHDNKSNELINEMVDFDDAIGVARRFAERDGSTLVLVTADHETGGYALVGGSLKDSTVVGKFSTIGHTATMVPVFGYGPGSERFSGIHENDEIGRRLIEAVGRK